MDTGCATTIVLLVKHVVIDLRVSIKRFNLNLFIRTTYMFNISLRNMQA